MRKEKQIKRPTQVLPSDKTFVGVLDNDGAYEVHIMSDIECFRTHFPELARKPLLHYRPFSEVLLALGYRDILQKLSISSIKNIIRKENPEEKDLSYNL